MTESTLTALSLVCSLKPSPAPSSSQLIAEHLQAELQKHGVTSETVRVVDHDVKPGVEKDMGDGDQWPTIRDKILALYGERLREALKDQRGNGDSDEDGDATDDDRPF